MLGIRWRKNESAPANPRDRFSATEFEIPVQDEERLRLAAVEVRPAATAALAPDYHHAPSAARLGTIDFLNYAAMG
jgi:hypothetical protein